MNEKILYVVWYASCERRIENDEGCEGLLSRVSVSILPHVAEVVEGGAKQGPLGKFFFSIEASLSNKKPFIHSTCKRFS